MSKVFSFSNHINCAYRTKANFNGAPFPFATLQISRKCIIASIWDGKKNTLSDYAVSSVNCETNKKTALKNHIEIQSLRIYSLLTLLKHSVERCYWHRSKFDNILQRTQKNDQKKKRVFQTTFQHNQKNNSLSYMWLCTVQPIHVIN